MPSAGIAPAWTAVRTAADLTGRDRTLLARRGDILADVSGPPRGVQDFRL
jgi:hypothetical protein